jgi:hypothetical protein
MRKVLWGILMAALGCVLADCNKAVIDMSKANDSYQCQYMKDICKESNEFETRYQKMTSVEKKEMKNVLHAYQSQCSDAIQTCEQTQKK